MASSAASTLQGNQIRVLKWVSTDEAGIHCTLDVIGLPEDSRTLEYEAISYVWGPKDEHATVWCKNLPGEVTEKAVNVSANLAPAIHYVWQNPDRRHVRLWCDSLSINQIDPEEKSRQVAMMDRIFKSAVRVHIWLGSRDLSGAFELLRKLVDHEDKAASLPAPELGLNEAKCVARLVINEWFCRVWTFQEARLAKSATVCCQHGEIEWSVFIRGITFLNKKLDGPHAIGDFARHAAILVVRLLDTENNNDDDATERRYEEDERRGANVGRVAGSLQLQRYLIFGESVHRTGTVDLTELLLQNWYRAATDPRDKVYALLSDELLQQDDNNPNVNYDISVANLFIKTARRCMNINKNLKVLQIAGMEHWRKYPGDWTNQTMSAMISAEGYVPSWVPNWAQFEMDLVLGATTIAGRRGLAAEHPPEQQVDDSSRLLKLDGFALGVVNFDLRKDSNHWLHMLPFNARTVSQILDALKARNDNHSSGSWAQPGFPARNSGSPLQPSFPSRGPVSTMHHVPETQKMRLSSERLPRKVRSGDWLCQLDGSITPFVLRPAPEISGKDKVFVLVGEAPKTWELLSGADQRGWPFIPDPLRKIAGSHGISVHEPIEKSRPEPRFIFA